jgi:hypothetical protein
MDKRKSDEYKQESKKKLQDSVSKKMQTIMIGALSSIEARLGSLWGQGECRKLTKEEIELRALYDEIRKDILDKGNKQKRDFELEINQYTIEWNRFKLTLPVRPN